MPTFAILGSGGWGTALAIEVARRPDANVRLWCRRGETAERLLRKRCNELQLKDVPIPDSVAITADAAEAVAGADAWIVAIPTAYLRATLKPFAYLAKPTVAVVSLTKGIEVDTFQRPSQIIRAELGMHRVAVLSGPSHAEEFARGRPTSLVAASRDTALTAWVQNEFGSERFRIYSNPDAVGVELAGALKNVLAIAAGICDGLNFGDNAKAALLTRGLVEMQRFGVTHGAKPETFFGMAGLGDVMTTCFSKHGRNRRLGEQLALGVSLAELRSGPTVAEGITTAKSVYNRLKQADLDMPIFEGVYRVLYDGLDLHEGIAALLDRPQREES